MMIEQWLKRRPRPAHLRVKLGDGETREIALGNVRSWARVAETVASLDPVHIEALNAERALIRATRIDSDDDEPMAPEPPTNSRAPRGASYDSETERFRIFADHMANAYRHATSVAFEKLVELYDANTARFEVQERTTEHLHKMVRRLSEDLVEQSEDTATKAASPTDELINNFMQGMAMSGAPVPPTTTPPKPNGRHS